MANHLSINHQAKIQEMQRHNDKVNKNHWKKGNKSRLKWF
ncbi:hypothetical protein KP78_29900 [Jeotgalibacillus soli]|uniref:Uncharacterized protein n=1 Tax=Jeotgalibacillus soli TaxID=889306 RepID=A0A0C2VLV6_9BACL|nr:hypothetical protein KP78_29900 [Jeotgalibacillus soli]